MFKKLRIASKLVSIQHPRWFFEALQMAQSAPHSFELLVDKPVQFLPSGLALLELFKKELQNLNIEFICKEPLVTQKKTFPIHEPNFSIDWFEQALKPIFFENFLAKQGKKISEDRAFDLQLLFSELTQNAKDHSGAEQFLVLLTPNEIGVFDLGVSIPAKLEQKYTFENDTQAIEYALKKGVTTRRLRSGGFGLYYTLDLLKKTNGELLIASRRGQVRRYLKNKKIDRKTLDPKMPGTLIYCRLEKLKP